ncbi:hypothetical protein F4775DRAFT_461178 [Biscogniauxia sp. FL1348]|nr:hypothetical protein F4775DRAFT_461178 [Biscogniauxia sp. FL1348]
MVSFFGAVLRLAFRRKPREGRMDEEHAHNVAGAAMSSSTTTRPTDSIAMASTLGANSHMFPHGRTPYLVSADDPLTLFRLMLGITTSPYLGFTETGPRGTRPAANIGIYARVVHSEQKAKDSFKVFSIVINACYFLQIVVAASLTAMGAAGSGSQAVTAFGAINTVIAGFLTFLKGSGLPGRLKYYGNEWKKIREFIEQRERDFMRAGCPLDVYEVVDMIEKMYNNTKQDIEMNTPDSYTSVTNVRMMGHEKDPRVGGIDVSKLESLVTKLSIGEKAEGLAAGLEKRTHGIVQGIHDREKDLENEIHDLGKKAEREVEDHKARLEHEAREREAQAREAINKGGRIVQDGKEQVADAASQLGRDLRNIPNVIVDEGKEATASHMRRMADKLG